MKSPCLVLILNHAGEKVWRLPLESEYMEQLKSPIADMVNTGGRLGGKANCFPVPDQRQRCKCVIIWG